MRIVHAYPGVMPHASEVARALAERGWLESHLTAAAWLPQHPLDRAALRALAALGRAGRGLDRRRLEGVPWRRVARSPGWELLRVVAGRLGPVAQDRVWEAGSLAFDRWVAGRVRPGQDAVIGYEHSCRATFVRARRLGVATVYNMTAPHYRTAEAVLSNEVGQAPGLRDRYRAYVERQGPRRGRHKDAEFALADCVIANSRLTAQSLGGLGPPGDRVAVVPLGAPPLDPRWVAGGSREKFVFLHAGSVSVRKGSHLLLQAWKQLAPRQAELWIAGGWQLPRLPDLASTPGVRELGNLSPGQLAERYLAADVLVFPTLCDGFGMVVTEAFAHGLPVLTTTAAGAADLVRSGENGLLVPPGDADRLAAALDWCLRDPHRTRAMRRAAAATAAARPWEVYRREYADCLARLLGRG
jgi:glycosyltransferase involved in cell wall biosynthesis